MAISDVHLFLHIDEFDHFSRIQWICAAFSVVSQLSFSYPRWLHDPMDLGGLKRLQKLTISIWQEDTQQNGLVRCISVPDGLTELNVQNCRGMTKTGLASLAHARLRKLTLGDLEINGTSSWPLRSLRLLSTLETLVLKNVETKQRLPESMLSRFLSRVTPHLRVHFL